MTSSYSFMHRELERVRRALAVRPPRAAETPERLEHAFESDDWASHLRNDVIAAAAERRLPVTIHSGLGIPSLGRDALALGERHPAAPLVLAHVGVTDLAWIWRRLGDHPSVFFDTAWWNPADHLAPFALVPAGRILLGSDAPYGTPAAAAIVAIRCGLQVGLTATQIEAVAGGQLERLLAGHDPLDLGPAPGPPRTRPPLLDRVFALLVGAL